jgi:phage shock protein A
MEKRRNMEGAEGLEREQMEHKTLIEQYQDNIRQLEDKLGAARDKQRILVQRHVHAIRKKRAQEDIRRMDGSDAIFKFEQLENRIERMEAEADLVNFGKKPTLQEEMDKLLFDDEIEKELQNLKTSLTKEEKS